LPLTQEKKTKQLSVIMQNRFKKSCVTLDLSRLVEAWEAIKGMFQMGVMYSLQDPTTVTLEASVIAI
jgi:hypothetical protein